LARGEANANSTAGPSALGRVRARLAAPRRPDPSVETVLILTPLKDAAHELNGYVQRLFALTHPHRAISLGFLESDSRDATFARIGDYLPMLRREFASAGLWKRDFGFQVPMWMHRAEPSIQPERRAVLARSRNHLLLRALRDQEWVLWLDVDVIDYPPDLIERLLATGKAIVQPHCVLEYGGPTFDTNGWRERGERHLDHLRGEGDLVELDAVGGTVLLVRADIHRDGLIFPPFPFGLPNERIRPGGEIETEGLGIMAREMGHIPWGMPHLEVRHRNQ
jgi:hypothetical protein